MRIYRDFSGSEYDSGRFLAAGASESYYIESRDESLTVVLSLLKGIMDNDVPVICESGQAGTLIEPGLMIFVGDKPDGSLSGKYRNYELSDLRIRKMEWEQVAPMIEFRNAAWQIKP